MTESKPFTGVNLLFGSYFFLFIAGELTLEERRERDRRTPRAALRRYQDSSFRYLFDSGDNQALLNCCGTTHPVFQELLALFKPYFDRLTFDDDGRVRKLKLSRSGKPIGRKRELDAVGCLGLVLYWYRTRGSVARAVAMAFGLKATPMYKWLKFGRRRVLLFAIQKVPCAEYIATTYISLQLEYDLSLTM